MPVTKDYVGELEGVDRGHDVGAVKCVGGVHGDVNGGQLGVRSEVEDGNERDEVENTEKSSSRVQL